MNYDFHKTAHELLTYDDVLIVTHRNPDGDTLCSASALCSALRRAGRKAYLFPNPQITERYSGYTSPYLAGSSFVPGYYVSVDVADTDMFADGFSGDVDLCIDHHGTNPGFAKKNCIFPYKSATAEIVLEIIEQMNSDVTPEEADLLYIGLSTDNGCFQYANTNSDSHLAAAKLIQFGADVYPLNEKFFRRFSRERIVLEGMIYSGMEFYHDSAVVISMITLDMLSASGAGEDDLDDIASLPGRIDSEMVGVTIRERSDGTSKISVRTRPGMSASEICAAFGGGGHTMAAGCTIHEKPERARKLILEVIDSLWK